MATIFNYPCEQQLELPLDPEVAIFCNPHLNMSVRAQEMSLGAYLDLRGWRKDYPDLELNRAGYLVERPDMGPANHSQYPFFIAWLGKTEFDATYRRGQCNDYSGLSLVPAGR